MATKTSAQRRDAVTGIKIMTPVRGSKLSAAEIDRAIKKAREGKSANREKK